MKKIQKKVDFTPKKGYFFTLVVGYNKGKKGSKKQKCLNVEVNMKKLIKEGTHFTKCTKEQLEWAKQFDKFGTEYLEKIWSDKKRYCLELTDPEWRNGHWISWEE